MSTHAREPKGSGCFGLRLAAWALEHARRGPATDADRPPVSVLPATRASAEAVRLNREHEARLRAARYRVVNRGGTILREAPPLDNVVPITAARGRR